MATFDELLVAARNTPLFDHVRVATVVAATDIMTEDPATDNHANRLLWAKQVFQNPDLAGTKMMYPVLAQNRAAPINSIINADDETVLAAVKNAINIFATGD
jgi:hypothetical protein